MDIFIGREVEGPQIGLLTLFFSGGGLRSLDHLKAVLAAHPQTTRFYFGAGNRRFLSLEDTKAINYLLNKNDFSCEILIETDPQNPPYGIPQHLIKWILFWPFSIKGFLALWKIMNTHRSKKPEVLKTIIGKTLYWHEGKKIYRNHIQHFLYLQDKEIVV